MNGCKLKTSCSVFKKLECSLMSRLKKQNFVKQNQKLLLKALFYCFALTSSKKCLMLIKAGYLFMQLIPGLFRTDSRQFEKNN